MALEKTMSSAARNAASAQGVSQWGGKYFKTTNYPPMSPATSWSRPEKTTPHSLNGPGTHSCTTMVRTFSGMRAASFHFVTAAYSFPADGAEAPSVDLKVWVRGKELDKAGGAVRKGVPRSARDSPLSDRAGGAEDSDLDGRAFHCAGLSIRVYGDC